MYIYIYIYHIDDGPTKTPVPIGGISQLAIFDHQPCRLLQEDTEENGYKLTENLLTVYKLPAKDAEGIFE